MRATIAIIAVCVAVFIAQAVFGEAFISTFSLVPASALSGQYWQFFTYMFLHGGLWHLTINMFILFMFGTLIERAIGWKWYMIMFMVSGMGSALFHIALSSGIPQSMFVPLIGASGGVFGVLAAFAFMFPDMKLFIIPIPVPIKAIYAIVGIAVFEFLLGVFNILPGIANFGHLGGIITGVLLMFYWRYAQRRRSRSRTEMRNFEFYWE